MKHVTHAQQQRIWDEEHQKPTALLQMDSEKPSSGVIHFHQWLRGQKIQALTGIEVCCGKGRNCVWLAEQGIRMTGVDFSPAAIEVALKRAAVKNMTDRTRFLVADLTQTLPIASEEMDIGIDCFGLTDIESPEGRAKARDELIRTLKKGGYLMAYASSVDCEYHAKRIRESPGEEPGTFVHPDTGKFEKSYTSDAFVEFYKPLHLEVLELIENRQMFSGIDYRCKNHWAVFRKS